MANNQYVNKVVFGNNTILDISEDTVVSSALLSGYTAHAGSGASISGSILTKTSSDLTANGLTVTVPSGYYETAATKTLADNNLVATNIKNGVTIFGVTGTLVGNTILVSDTIDANGGTIRTITTTEDPIYLETLNVTSNGTYTPTSGHYYSSVSVEVEGSGVAAILQEKTNITPTESSQTIEPDSGYNGLSSVQINAIPSTYVGSGITSRNSTDLSASGNTVTVPAGYYSTQATKAVSSGSATAPANISGTSASISTSTNTITLTKTVSVTPSVTAGYISTGTAGNSEVSLTASVTVNPTPTASGATVTIPAGYYSVQTTKSVSSMTLPTSATSSATSGYSSKATIGRSTSDQYINIPTGYNSNGAYYKISAVANGSATGPSSLSGSSATLSTGTNTITLTKTGVTTTPTVSAGYVSAATASTATVTLTASVTTKAAATITPGTSDQTIASGTYLTGTQTISGDADLIASNIKTGVNIFGVAGSYTSDATAEASEILSGETAYVNGSKLTGSLVITTVYVGSAAPSAATGINGDIYIKS